MTVLKPVLNPVLGPVLSPVLGSSLFFLPTDLAGLKLWLDAADAGTITESGGLVSQWSDKSSEGNNATQFTGALQPVTGTQTVNGLNVVDFDGIDDLMELSSQPLIGTEARTIIVVGYAIDDTGTPTMVSLTDVGVAGERYEVSAEIGLRISAANSFWLDDAVESGVAAIIMMTNEANSTLVEDSDNLQAYRDGALITSTAQANPTTSVNTISGTATISHAARQLNGVIGEVIIYDRVISFSERTLLDNYLSSKWGIPTPFPFAFSSDFSSDFS